MIKVIRNRYNLRKFIGGQGIALTHTYSTKSVRFVDNLSEGYIEGWATPEVIAYQGKDFMALPSFGGHRYNPYIKSISRRCKKEVFRVTKEDLKFILKYKPKELAELMVMRL